MSSMLIAKTFEMRGVSLPLTTDCLCHTRLRVNAQLEWEAMLPDLGADKGAYLVPWSDMYNIKSLSLHDRAFLEALDKELILSPSIVREHAISINGLGYDGADNMEAATLEFLNTKKIHSTVLALLMARFCAQAEGLDLDAIPPDDLLGDDGQERLQRAFISFSQSHGISTSVIAERIEFWADKMTSCGFEIENSAGHLLTKLNNLTLVAEELSDWLTEETSESVAKTRLVMDALLSTYSLGKSAHDELLKLALDIKQGLVDWDDTKAYLDTKLSMLSWVLDGWGKISDMWARMRNAHRYQKRISVHKMMQFFPIMPEEILTPTQVIVWESLRKEQLAWRLIGNDFHPIVYNQEILAKLIDYPFVEYI